MPRILTLICCPIYRLSIVWSQFYVTDTKTVLDEGQIR